MDRSDGGTRKCRIGDLEMVMVSVMLPVRETQHAKSKHKQLFHNKEPQKTVTAWLASQDSVNWIVGMLSLHMLECWNVGLKL